MLFFLIFPETVRAEEGDQVGPQAQEDFCNSSTDSCLTFSYSSNSPRPFPPSPVHSVTDSPIRVSPLFIATSNNSPVPRSIDHYSPVPAASTFPISTSSQTFTSILFTPTTVSYNTPLYTPYSSNPFPQTGPIVFPGSSPDFPYFGTRSLGLTLLFLTLFPLLPILYLPWSLSLLCPSLSFLLDLSPPLGLGPLRDVVGVLEVPTVGGEELPRAEEAKSPPPPVVRPLPSPAIFGLTISQVQSPLGVLLLMMP